MNSYFRRLAFALRMKNHDEVSVSSIVGAAQELVAADGRSPELVLGEVEDHAGSCPEPAQRSRRMKITHGVLYVLTAALVLYLVGRLVLPAIDVGVSAGLLSYLGGFLIVMVVGIVHAHRRPRDLPS